MAAAPVEVTEDSFQAEVLDSVRCACHFSSSLKSFSLWDRNLICSASFPCILLLRPRPGYSGSGRLLCCVVWSMQACISTVRIYVLLHVNSARTLRKLTRPRFFGFCRSMDLAAVNYEGKLKVVKIDTEVNKTFVDTYNIRGLPTFAAFKSGKAYGIQEGALGKDGLKAYIEKHCLD